MSSAEPFMPEHEPPAPRPDTERDIDHDVDVFPDDAAVEAPDGSAFDAETPAPPFRPPVPGARLTPEELAADLGDAD
ncbi:hypothetical protein [Microbacterium sp. SS28]|uniref:hypothetical protein n=1 Tax=Microbacterium sp. SS28 TaxID=2919948 RepID=UPI001FAB08B9|nr:hypothetical protein [Microbacterium sp. SS28]